jgi:two-component system NtrC family response regulator
MVKKGQFRSDLLFRLKAFPITLPPLRDRKEDIRDLCYHFINSFCERLQIKPKGISTEFIEHLAAYNWPGNIRELQQALEQIVATFADYPTLFAHHLPQDIRIANAQATISTYSNRPATKNLSAICPLNWKQFKTEEERKYIIHLMTHCSGDIKKAIDISGLSRARLYQLIKRFDISSKQLV